MDIQIKNGLHFDCNRFDQGTSSTVSKLYANGQRYVRPDGKYVYILEDQDRGMDAAKSLAENQKLKKDHETCIPYSKSGKPYDMSITYSNKFVQDWNQILGIPCFDGVRLHSGLVVAHTWGCPMAGVGMKANAPDKDSNGYYRIWDSKVTVAPLLLLIAKAFKQGVPITWSVNKDY